MKLISLHEFREISGISDSAMLNLLERNLISCTLDSEDGLMVDIESVSTTKLVKAIAMQRKELIKQDQDILVEKVAKIMREQLDSIVEEAIAASKRDGSH